MNSEPDEPRHAQPWQSDGDGFAMLQDRVDAAFIPDEALAELAKGVEHVCHESGWDQPARLFALVSSTDVPSASDVGGHELPFGMSAVMAVHVLDVQGNPREELVGLVAPPATLGLVLVSETWSFPVDVTEDEARRFAPSDHPRRVESRDVILVTADGRQTWSRRVRGEDGVTSDKNMKLRGPLVNVVRAALQINPNETVPAPVAVVCSALSVLALSGTRLESPTSDPAFFVAASLRILLDAGGAGFGDDGIGAESIDMRVQSALASFRTLAQDRFDLGEDWLDDDVLGMFVRAPAKTLLVPLARLLLDMGTEEANWWPVGHLAFQIADAGANIEVARAAAAAGSAGMAEVERIVAKRLERLRKTFGVVD